MVIQLPSAATVLTESKNHSLKYQPEPYTKCTGCDIRKAALFQGVPYGRLEWTQQYRKAQFVVNPRDQIYLEQIEPTYAFTLFSGWVALYQTLENGQRQILRIALPGDLIGFQRNADGTATHSAEAITSVKLCAFPVSNFPTMMADQPEVAVRLIEMTSRDIAICQQHLVCAGKKNAREKIAYFLLETLHRVRRQIPKEYSEADNSIYFPLTQEDIGDTLGLTNVHVNRVVKLLQNDGILKCHHRRLSIFDEKTLSEIGQFDVSMLDEHPLV